MSYWYWTVTIPLLLYYLLYYDSTVLGIRYYRYYCMYYYTTNTTTTIFLLYTTVNTAVQQLLQYCYSTTTVPLYAAVCLRRTSSSCLSWCNPSIRRMRLWDIRSTRRSVFEARPSMFCAPLWLTSSSCRLGSAANPSNWVSLQFKRYHHPEHMRT